MKDFHLKIVGDLGTVLPSEVADRNNPFGKAWYNFLREIDTAGCKITDARIETAGKTVSLPVTVHAGT